MKHTHTCNPHYRDTKDAIGLTRKYEKQTSSDAFCYERKYAPDEMAKNTFQAVFEQLYIILCSSKVRKSVGRQSNINNKNKHFCAYWEKKYKNKSKL